MAEFILTSPEGERYRVTGPEGATEAEAFQVLQQQLEAGTAQPVEAPAPAAPEPGGLGDVVRGVTGANVPERGERSLGEQAHRGVGLGARNLVGAIPKTLSGIADLGETAINFLGQGIDTADRFVAENVFGRDPRPPTGPLLDANNVSQVDALLNQFFPQPETMGERAVELGTEAVVTGAGGGAALARRLPQVRSPTPSLGEDVGRAFADSPKAATAAEFGGGAGAQAGGELAADADLGPGGQLLATLGGGLAGAVAPSAGVRSTRGVLESGRRAIEPVTPSGAERRAARELQSQARDPAAAAQASREAPEGVTGARASEDPGLRRIERKVAEDDPVLADTIDETRRGAEARTIDEFTAGLPEGSDPVDWQRRVVTRAAPEGTAITADQPDEMLDEAFQSFRQGYAEAEGYPVQTQTIEIEGGNVPLPEMIGNAVIDPMVLAGDQTRRSVGKWLGALMKDVSRRGEPITPAADETVVQFDSRDLLDLRQAVRAKQRQQARAGQSNPDAAATAEILSNVDDAITETLESQLPESASDALRALDARYADFKTVEDATLRGKPGELTPDKLEQAIKMRSGSRGRVARGDTGELGTIAEQGRDVTKFLGKGGEQDQKLRRTMRSMDETQAKAARSDIVRDLNSRASSQSRGTGEWRLDGDKLLKEIETNESTLRAAGFQEGDLNRMKQLARRLRMIQSDDPRAAPQIIDDTLGAVQGLVSRLAGARIAKRLSTATGAGGPGVLSTTGFLARMFERAFGTFSISHAERLIRDAMEPTPEGRKLFEALMTRETAPELKKVRSRRILNAWATQAASVDDGEE